MQIGPKKVSQNFAGFSVELVLGWLVTLEKFMKILIIGSTNLGISSCLVNIHDVTSAINMSGSIVEGFLLPFLSHENPTPSLREAVKNFDAWI